VNNVRTTVDAGRDQGYLLIAADQGLVALNDPLEGGLPTPEPGTTLTHLLTHTASIADDLDALDAAIGADIEPDLAGWMETELAREGLHTGEPLGTAWAYSNTGIALAALEVERAAEQPFQDWLERELFEPLDMDARLDPEGFGPALRYEDTRDWVPAPTVASHVWPAGFLYATAHDYTRFLVAVSQDPRLAPMLAPATDVDRFGFLPYTAQGMGMQRFEDLGGRQVWGHMGGYWGANTIGLVAPDQGLAVVVLSTGGPDPGFWSYRALTILAGAMLDRAG
jgi:CubicO group peptidase (beta-lactamase class C family)